MSAEDQKGLVVNIERVPEGGFVFERELPPDWLDNIPEYWDESIPSATRARGPISVSGKLTRVGPDLRLQGLARLTLDTECTRCGGPAEHVILGELDLFLTRGREPELEAERELTPEELEANYFEGDEIDLSPYFREEIALQVPIQVLCSEECKGLCPGCGADLNAEACSCPENEGDPRLAALRNLKIN